jgi:hypothetical protein
VSGIQKPLTAKQAARSRNNGQLVKKIGPHVGGSGFQELKAAMLAAGSGLLKDGPLDVAKEFQALWKDNAIKYRKIQHLKNSMSDCRRTVATKLYAAMIIREGLGDDDCDMEAMADRSVNAADALMDSLMMMQRIGTSQEDELQSPEYDNETHFKGEERE